MAKSARNCIFCGGTGLTDEHVVPDWLKKIIKKTKNDGNVFTLQDHSSGHLSRRVRQGNPITQKVHVVCARCNNGWLSILEDELKPTLTELITGNQITLDPWKTRRLATWAVKTTMTAEFLHPPTAAISFEMREHLRLHRQPHPKFDVWVGCYGDKGMLLGMEHHAAQTIKLQLGTKPTESPDVQVTIIGLGHLFLQIGYVAADGARFEFEDQTTDFLTRIWPPLEANYNWPPQFMLDAEGLQLICEGVHVAFGSKPLD